MRTITIHELLKIILGKVSPGGRPGYPEAKDLGQQMRLVQTAYIMMMICTEPLVLPILCLLVHDAFWQMLTVDSDSCRGRPNIVYFIYAGLILGIIITRKNTGRWKYE